DLADLGLEFQIDQPVVENHRGEVEADAVFLELDGDPVVVLSNRNRYFTACKEACRFSRKGNEVGFRQAACQTLVLQGLHENVGADASAEDLRDHRAERNASARQERIDNGIDGKA